MVKLYHINNISCNLLMYSLAYCHKPISGLKCIKKHKYNNNILDTPIFSESTRALDDLKCIEVIGSIIIFNAHQPLQ